MLLTLEHYSEILDDYKFPGNTKGRPIKSGGCFEKRTADEFQIAMKKHLDLYFHLFDINTGS